MKKLTLLLSILISITLSAKSEFTLYDLSCEQTTNPIGLESQKPCFSWKLISQVRGFRQKAYQVMVATSGESLKNGKELVWNSGEVSSSQSVLVPYEGTSLKSATIYYWKVRSWNQKGKVSEWSEINQFTTGLLSTSDWNASKWIALQLDDPNTRMVPGLHNGEGWGDKPTAKYSMPQFRKEFTLKKEVKQALAFVTGLGQFDFFLNGKKAGEHFLDPGWTNYDKEVLYVTFDLTKQLKQGKNAIGFMLGGGFYTIPKERYYKLLTSFGAPKARLQLHMTYADGTSEIIATDETWKVTESPITYSSIYGGEDYDATKEQEGWMLPDFNDAQWKPALVTNSKAVLHAQTSTPLSVREEVPVVQLFKNEAGQWVYDLGQNFSGIVRIAVKGKQGKKVVLRPAELLNTDKTVNQSASGSPYYFAYTTKGATKGETWQPQFSYYGFRYVQLEGAVPAGQPNPDGLPEVSSLVGLHTCNEAPEAGTFSCSNPMFNKIYTLIDWAMRSNMASVLTDCPHREKLGWLEQAHLMQYSLQYRYNLSRLYPKIMSDMYNSKNENGCIWTIAPEYVHFSSGFEDTPEWGSTFIISPWYIYQWYGDKRIIETYYPSMQHYLNYLTTRAKDNIIAYGLGDWFDIGPGNPGNAQLTSNGLSATAIYYYNTTLMQKMATLLGKTADATKYEALGKQIKSAFNEKFFNKETKVYEKNSQTASAMALYMGLVEPDNTKQILENLKSDIRGRNNALTAGDIGYRYVLRVLEAAGESELIYAMNSKYDVPGYGWQLAHGATALTESWQAYGFVSNNHFMLGHLMEWLFSGLGGIRQTENSVGYSTVLIDPQIVGDIRSASSIYASPYGEISCKWERSANEYQVEVTIPANSDAVVCLPAVDAKQVSDFDRPLSACKEIKVVVADTKKLQLKIGSGHYLFKVKDINQ